VYADKKSLEFQRLTSKCVESGFELAMFLNEKGLDLEDDYYEWLKDNFKSFFGGGEVDWEWIKGRIKLSVKED
jgi:hypothetical protein